MLTREEKAQMSREFWDPCKTVENFQWMIENWCADFPTIRQGVIALTAEVHKTGLAVHPDTLRRYADGAVREPSLPVAVAVVQVILSKK